MRILIAFCTSTGNTERIARAMGRGINDHELDVLEINDYESRDLKKYDLIILGSGVYLGLVGDKITELVRNALNFPKYYACFYSRERKEPYNNAFRPVHDAAKKHKTEYLRECHCLGEPLLYYTMEDYKDAVKNFEQYGFHPDRKDLQDTIKFLESIIMEVEKRERI